METVDLRSIDPTKLFLMDPDMHSESTIYTDYTHIYKIFEEISVGLSRRKEAKVDYLARMNEKHGLVLPNQKIIYRDTNTRIFLGYRAKYINGVTLFEIQHRINDYEYFELLSRISREVKSIHNENDRFVFGDLNFNNILVNSELDFFFIDLDGCSIGNLKNERISAIISEYMGFRNKYLKINRNLDRLTFFLYVLDYIFGRAIFEVSLYEYDEKTEIYEFLKDIKDLFIELNRTDRLIPYIPYTFEYIDDDKINKMKMLVKKSEI